MQILDWIVLVGALTLIIVYGIWKSRNIKGSEDFLVGKRDLPWWTIGLSIMATQASAITFLSTPGQGFADGMQFAQFYFGMPIAMLILAYFVLPIYYGLRVTTAYEYLEKRFDVRMRALTAVLFLIQRGVAAAISIYAPSIILSTVLGWDLGLTNFLMAVFVVIYTTSGGSAAVSRTQEMQMTIILFGLFLSLYLITDKLPEGVGIKEAWDIAGVTGKTQIIDTGFSWNDRYNIWSGILGSTFLFLSYFGTDQSQVGRYLSGKSLRESRFGLLFNGFVKVPMQLLILSVGVLVFAFFQFNAPPLHFNQTHSGNLEKSALAADYHRLEQRADSVFQIKQTAMNAFLQENDPTRKTATAEQIRTLEAERQNLRYEAKTLLARIDKDSLEFAKLQAENPKDYKDKLNSKFKDSDYVYINYVLKYIPAGIIGLLIAMIFCASWSTTASELSALTSTSVSDIYRRLIVPGQSDRHYYVVSRWTTVLWGVFIVLFATYASLFENLIQLVNMVGSVFYGTILGVFFTAFFLKRVRGRAVFVGAVIAQTVVCILFFFINKDAYLWYNPLGCGIVMGVSLLLSYLWPEPEKAA